MDAKIRRTPDPMILITGVRGYGTPKTLQKSLSELLKEREQGTATKGAQK